MKTKIVARVHLRQIELSHVSEGYVSQLYDLLQLN